MEEELSAVYRIVKSNKNKDDALLDFVYYCHILNTSAGNKSRSASREAALIAYFNALAAKKYSSGQTN